jgi:hypothetical protein
MSRNPSEVNMMLSALILLSADAVAVEESPKPLSQHETIVRATTTAVDEAFRSIGTMTANTMKATPAAAVIDADYANAFGQAITSFPKHMCSEGAYQKAQADKIMSELHFSGAVDSALERIDVMAGRIIDEVSKPDVVLRGLQSYRDKQTLTEGAR